MGTRFLAIYMLSSLAVVNAGWASEARITQLIKEAKVLVLPDNIERPASIDDVLQAQNILSTGSDSLAELQMEGRTVIRAGAKSTFSVDEQGRVFKLRQGSLLLSALDKQENTIDTPFAQVTVPGATVIVSSAPGEGGFKLLVDEGIAKVRFANGTSRMLKAGEMTLVQAAEARGIKSVPVRPFQLERQIKGSRLIRGFLQPLPSQVKLVAAITAQRRDLGQKVDASSSKTGDPELADLDEPDDADDSGKSNGKGGSELRAGLTRVAPTPPRMPLSNPIFMPLPDQFSFHSVYFGNAASKLLAPSFSMTPTTFTPGGTVVMTSPINVAPVSTLSFASSITSPTISRITANVNEIRVQQLLH